MITDMVNINVRIPRDVLNELNNLIPLGMRSNIYNIITKDLIKLLKSDSNRELIFGALCSGRLKLEEWSQVGSVLKGEDNG